MASHKQLSGWYTRLGQNIEAGIVLADALRLTDGPPAKSREAMARQIEAGMPFEDVLRQAPKWLPQADRLFLVAAMQTGRLPQTFKDLAERHARIGATQIKVILGLIYPLSVFHIFVLLLPVTRMIDYEVGFRWDLAAYLKQVSVLLLPLWAVIILVTLLARSQHPLLTLGLRALPLLRKYSKTQRLADFSSALGTFLHAGVAAPTAWKFSAQLTGEPAFKRALDTLKPVFARGENPADYLDGLKCFPPDFKSYYKAGVATGKLDENMLRAGAQYQTTANQAMTFASIVYPSLIFAVVAVLVVISIFKVYGNYLKMFDQFL